eukprot:1196294-Prorocentrum_minimum.AAC.3
MTSWSASCSEGVLHRSGRSLPGLETELHQGESVSPWLSLALPLDRDEAHQVWFVQARRVHEAPNARSIRTVMSRLFHALVIRVVNSGSLPRLSPIWRSIARRCMMISGMLLRK